MMTASVIILVLALVTLWCVNRALASDHLYYKNLADRKWQQYQSQASSHRELLAEHIELQNEFAAVRDLDGARLALQADLIVKLRKHCLDVKQKLHPQIELMRIMLDAIEAVDLPVVAYGCRVCGCKWRDNGDATMSLFDAEQSACSACERAPLADMYPIAEVITQAGSAGSLGYES